MGLVEEIQNDIADILGNDDEYGVELVFTAPAPGNQTATINGLHTKHHTAVDGETGLNVNSKNAHCSFSEQHLTAAGYPVRNAGGEVAMKGHKVTATDSTGTSVTYKIMETKPDETIGVIVCILEDFE